MSWIQKYLSQNQIQEISEAVRKAESTTSGEIVPVIVRRSSAVGHVRSMIAMVLVMLTVAIELPFKDILFSEPWIYTLPILVVLHFAIANWLARFNVLQRIFTANADEFFQVEQRAQLEFFLNDVNRTSQGTGILVFVSVMERKAVILADRKISEKIDPRRWQELVNALTARLKKGQWSEGFIETIQECGKILSTHFPISSHDTNELSNQLVIKD